MDTFRMVLALLLIVLTIIYFMFGYHRKKTQRGVYYLPFCVVISGFLFLTLHGLRLPWTTHPTPICEEVDLTQVIDTDLESSGLQPVTIQGIGYKEHDFDESKGLRHCEARVIATLPDDQADIIDRSYYYDIINSVIFTDDHTLKLTSITTNADE